MKKWTFLRLVSFSVFALSLWACGGVGKAEKDPFLASAVERINAEIAARSASDTLSRFIGFNLAFEERGLVLTAQFKMDDVPDEVLLGAMVVVETLKSSPEGILGVKGGDGNQGNEVSALDVLDKLRENNVDFIICAKEKNGDVLAEAVLKSSKFKELRKKIEEKEEARRKAEEEKAIFFADIEKGTFEDPRDHHVYRTGTIVGETWIADDLAYGIEVPPCDTSSRSAECDPNSSWYKPPVGKKYTWDEAQKACPDGWHLPTIDDFTGGRFSKFNRGSEYIDMKRAPGYWSTTVRKDSGEERLMVFQVTVQREDDRTYYSSDTTAVPMSKANLPEFGKFVRCIKNR
jgi:hypothetical protein